jgi:hypothetical protein
MQRSLTIFASAALQQEVLAQQSSQEPESPTMASEPTLFPAQHSPQPWASASSSLQPPMQHQQSLQHQTSGSPPQQQQQQGGAPSSPHHKRHSSESGMSLAWRGLNLVAGRFRTAGGGSGNVAVAAAVAAAAAAAAEEGLEAFGSAIVGRRVGCAAGLSCH